MSQSSRSRSINDSTLQRQTHQGHLSYTYRLKAYPKKRGNLLWKVSIEPAKKLNDVRKHLSNINSNSNSTPPSPHNPRNSNGWTIIIHIHTKKRNSNGWIIIIHIHTKKGTQILNSNPQWQLTILAKTRKKTKNWA